MVCKGIALRIWSRHSPIIVEGSTPDSEVKYLHNHETKGDIDGKELDSNVLLSRHHSTVRNNQ